MPLKFLKGKLNWGKWYLDSKEEESEYSMLWLLIDKYHNTLCHIPSKKQTF